MKKLVEDRFNDIEAAITNRETDVVLSDKQNGNRKRQKHTRSVESKELEESNDKELEELKKVGESEEYTGISRSNKKENG